MSKKYILIVFINFCTAVYAVNNSVGNYSSVRRVGTEAAGQILPIQKLNVKYTVFNYQMNPKEFAIFLEAKSLSRIAMSRANTNIVSLNVIKKEELDNLNQNLAKEFSGRFSGGNTCVINNDICAGGTVTSDVTSPKTGMAVMADKTSIVFKIFSDNKNISAKIISDNQMNNKSDPKNLILLKSEATIQDIKNKNYAIVSQISKNGTLYGQIILVSFGNS